MCMLLVTLISFCGKLYQIYKRIFSWFGEGHLLQMVEELFHVIKYWELCSSCFGGLHNQGNLCCLISPTFKDYEGDLLLSERLCFPSSSAANDLLPGGDGRHNSLCS